MTIDKNIIIKCKQGDVKAQEYIYEEYSPIMLGICTRYMKDRMLAEDIMQETFMVIFAKVGQFKDIGSFEGWMKRIMVNACLKYLQKNKGNYHYDIEDVRDEQVYSIQPNQEENDVNYKDSKSVIENTEFSKEEIMKVVSELPDGFRIVFNLYAIEGFKHKEIAEQLNISISTSKTQLIRARKQLQHKLFKLGLKKHDEKNKKYYNEVISQGF